MTYIQVIFSDGSVTEFPIPEGIDENLYVEECNIIDEYGYDTILEKKDKNFI